MLTATDNVTGLDISELVDMESEPGCEHPQHVDHPSHAGKAWGVLRRNPTPCCHQPANTFLICESAYRAGVATGVLSCYYCHSVVLTSEAWTLVSVL